MDTKEASEFKKKLDEILADTEKFVKASRQLEEAKAALEKYLEEARSLSQKMQQQYDEIMAFRDELNEKQN